MKLFGQTAATNLCQVCIFAMQGMGNVCWREPLLWLCIVVPQPRLRWVTILPVGDYSSGFTRACSILYEDDLVLSCKELLEFVFFTVIHCSWLSCTIESKVQRICIYLFWYLCWCLCWFRTMLCAVLGAGKAHKNSKRISERQANHWQRQKVFSSSRRELLTKRKGTITHNRLQS